MADIRRHFLCAPSTSFRALETMVRRTKEKTKNVGGGEKREEITAASRHPSLAVAIGCKSNKNARNGSVKGGEGGRDIKVSGGGSETRRRKKERERDRVVWRNSRPPFGLEHREKLALLLKKLGACYLAGISSINCAASLSRGLFLRVQPQWPRRLPTVNLTGILPRCKPINNFALL